MTQIDQAVDIREGEELDVAAVDRFMKQAIPDLEGQPDIKQYPRRCFQSDLPGGLRRPFLRLTAPPLWPYRQIRPRHAA